MNALPIMFGVCSEKAGRPVNEDFAAVHALPAPLGEATPTYIAAAADGMGGAAAGEVASRTAVEAFIYTAASLLSGGPMPEADGSLRDAVDRGFEEANATVFDRGQGNGMGTTLTAAVISGQRLCIGHVGDSRAYLIRGGAARQITKDHSRVQDKVDAGILTEAEAAVSPERNQLTRVVGTRPSVVADLYCEDLQDGDVVVLFSDGLRGNLWGPGLAGELAGVVAHSPDPQTACSFLVAQAKQRDGSDNITAVCVGIGRWPGVGRHGPGPKGRNWLRALRRPALVAALAVVLAMIAGVSKQIWKPTPPPQQEEQTPAPGEPRPVGKAQFPLPLTVAIRVSGGIVSVTGNLRNGLDLRVGRQLLKPNQTTLRLPDVYRGAPNQAVSLHIELDQQPRGRVKWTLTREPASFGKTAIPRGLFVDGDNVVSSDTSHEMTGLGVTYKGKGRVPKHKVDFRLTGPTPVPVEIRFRPPTRGANAVSAATAPKASTQTPRANQQAGRHNQATASGTARSAQSERTSQQARHAAAQKRPEPAKGEKAARPSKADTAAGKVKAQPSANPKVAQPAAGAEKKPAGTPPSETETVVPKPTEQPQNPPSAPQKPESEPATVGGSHDE